MIIIIVISFIILALIFLLYNYKKYEWIKIKLAKAKQEVSDELNETYMIQKQFADLLELKIEDINDNTSLEKLNNQIITINQCINNYLDNNEKLVKKEDIRTINKKLHNYNISLKAARKYYNENIVKYNKLCSNMPSKIIAMICRYKTKDILKNDVQEQLKIIS